jgi:hypothetical protein
LLLQAIGCAQAYYSSLGESISAGEALARMADHFVATWTEYLKQRKTSSERREVLMRTGGLCAMPGCSRAAVHDHHIDFRSHGGSDELSNRVGLCQVCHLRGVHKGYLEVVGRAGELLRFRVRTSSRAPRQSFSAGVRSSGRFFSKAPGIADCPRWPDSKTGEAVASSS